MKDLIDLQHSHVTQITKNGVLGDWSVQTNETNVELHVLPGHLSDRDIFTIMEFARKFELIAFNSGIQFQKGKTNAALVEENAELKRTLQSAIDHGDRLADKLQSLISHEE